MRSWIRSITPQSMLMNSGSRPWRVHWIRSLPTALPTWNAVRTLLGFGLPPSAFALVGLWFAIGLIGIILFGFSMINRRWNLLPILVTISSLVLQGLVLSGK